MSKPQYAPKFYKNPNDKIVPFESYHKHEPNYKGTSYLRTFVIPGLLRRQIDLTVRALRPHAATFDSIAFSGMSGALIAPSVAMALGKEIIMVRKKDQSSHSMHEVEGDFNARKYIIVDDFRDTGNTERYIIGKIKSNIPQAEYMGFISSMHLREIDVEAAETFGEPIPLLPRKLDKESEYVGISGTFPYSNVVQAAERNRGNWLAGGGSPEGLPYPEEYITPPQQAERDTEQRKAKLVATQVHTNTNSD